jgi:hypothetical protein
MLLKTRQDCCENCWDSDGKIWGIEGNAGESAREGFYKKIRGLATFSRFCQSP